MKKYFALLTLFLLCEISNAQSAIDRVTGNFSSDLVYAVRGKSASGKYENIKRGTPYFMNLWLPAKVTLFNGKQFDSVEAKIDLLGHKFLYKENGVEFEAESPIKEVILHDVANSQDYNFVHSTAFPNPVNKGEEGWYLLLGGVDAKAFKYIIKEIEESRQYSSAITERSINSKVKYFISYKNILIPVKKLKDVPEILRNKEQELLKYMEQQNLNKLSDENMEKLISYYNSLVQ
jgi:hypothetical protein